MYADMNDAELQAWLLSEGVIGDSILASEADWQAASAFQEGIRVNVYASQYQRDGAAKAELEKWVDNDDGL